MFTKNDYKMTLHYDNSAKATKYNLIKFFKSLGLTVKTTTKARGNQGIYTKNRIDISKDTAEKNIVPVLVHEFAHHIHYKIEGNKIANGGTLEKIFKTNDISQIQKELYALTHSQNSENGTEYLSEIKKETLKTIKKLQSAIQKDFPMFQRSKPFREFDRYIKHSSAKYLLKYDQVRIREGFFFAKTRIISIDTIEKDYPEMPTAFQLYLRLKSEQKKQTKLSKRINSLKKYYLKPSELFARYVQNYFTAKEETKEQTPQTTARFEDLLSTGYYYELKDLLELFSKR